MDSSLEKCFICAEETSQHFRNLMELTTKFSGTLIFKVIERFLERDLSDIGTSLIVSVICQECVVKLNDYDAAHTKALIIQKEFTELLIKNMTLVGNKAEPNQQMFFKEEDNGLYLDYLVELDHIQPGDEPIADVEDIKTIIKTEKSISLKCNTCGIGFQSLDEMRHHSHKTTVEELQLEFLGDSMNFCLDDSEYVDEEHLDEEDNREEENEQENDDQHFEQLVDSDSGGTLQESVQIIQMRCVDCDIVFGSKAKLKLHMKEHHPLVKSTHVCNICGLALKTKSALSSHAAKHSRASSYDCTFCGKQFQQKGALARHVPIHTGEKPYQCDKCGKRFIHYSSFHMHQLAHGNIREKKCEICGFMLRSSSHLKRHMRVHSGEKPFECPTCGQKFAQRYNMMTHLKAHQGIYRDYSKVYKCPFCVQTFQRKLKLQEHVSREHNTVVDSALLKPMDRPKKTPILAKVEFTDDYQEASEYTLNN
ncbi:zinc finger protein OZF-like [Toxorhynchites rutilus septentrionalis]|uniref:zinc finger protein OZF-like n=1 Tax=Toxorhynchites rutilus septentrionalis TaxID=329112 RepID=UPI00247A711C|nr:zinc finger protein OZF-like [Toxorhynchites rutilus septentrionalis]